MVINVPVIAQTDVLLLGGAAEQIRAACRLKARNFSVFAAMPRNYCGDDLGSTLDFHAAAPDPEFFPDFPDALPTPMTVKRSLERQLIGSGISFLYRCFPVRRIEDENGCFAGMVLACRSGLVAVRARVLLDGSMRRWGSTVAGAPQSAFVPGEYGVERILVGAPPPKESPLKVSRLEPGFVFEEKEYPVFRASGKFHFDCGDWPELCRIEAEMRQLVWSPEQVFAPDSCTFDLPSALKSDFTPCEKFPFVTSAADAEKMLERCKPGEKLSIPGENGNYKFAAVRFDNAPRYRKCEKLPFRLNSLPRGKRSSVIVAGGGTGGAPAALGAARSSANVLCLESSCHLGGLTTQGRIASYWFGNRRGYSCELDRNVAEMGPDTPYPAEGRKWDIEWKQHHFLRSAIRGGVEIYFNTIAVGALRRGELVSGVISASPDGCRLLESTAVIDATGNADVAAAAGAVCEFADPREPALQGSGVSRANPGVGYANCDYCFTADSDALDATSAWVRGREKYAGAFDIASVIGTRERRRISGDLQLKVEDFLLGRSYHDTIVEAISNFDTHGFTVHGLLLLKETSEEPLTAKVPYRALLPKGLDGILVTGLGISAHRDAMPVVRMECDVQNQGFAAGLAAGMTANCNRTVRNVDMQELKRMLCSIGNLPESVLSEQDGYDPEKAVPEFAEFAEAFRDPEGAIAPLCRKLDETKDPLIAALLAFLGSSYGREILVNFIESVDGWDKGWEYRGMGQFGFAVSPLDARIIALSRIADGSEKKGVLRLLEKLESSDAFSHFRALSLILSSSPQKEAVPFLEKLLDLPELKECVELSFKEIVDRNTPDPCENFQRTCQLKEFYLLKALAACDPENALAAERQKRYAETPLWLYASFAGK